MTNFNTAPGDDGQQDSSLFELVPSFSLDFDGNGLPDDSADIREALERSGPIGRLTIHQKCLPGVRVAEVQL